MKSVITGHDEVFGPWLMDKCNGAWVPGRGSTIGLWDEVKGPVAATFYEGCNGASILMHVAGEGKDWLNREFLWFSFYYPFEQLKLKKIICSVDSTNVDCVKFVEHIGFDLEATLKDASPKGDLRIYTMIRENCKWLSLKDRKSGKTNSTISA